MWDHLHEQLSRRELQSVLTQRGKEDWQLVSVCVVVQGATERTSESTIFDVFFKRLRSAKHR